MPKILLDAGHYGKYNKSPANSNYYESIMAWKLTNYQKEELETYENMEVHLTRLDINTDIGVYDRGAMAKGYDMFISNHSNAVGSSRNDKVDYPVVYRLYADTGIGNNLAYDISKGIQELMGTIQAAKVSTRLLNNGNEYYGVLRGAKAVGCKHAYIIEHSFHTAYKPATWLLSDENLKRLAVMEAALIAKFFNVQKKKEGLHMLNPYQGEKFRVTSVYGMRGSEFHAGLDIVGEGKGNKNLVALCDGTITQSRMVPKSSGDLTWQWGNYVCLKADTGELIFYCHLSQRLVSKGQRVKKGDIIGVEGNTGYSFGSHCHLEIRSAENKVTSSVNTPKFTGIPNKIGTYIVEKEEDKPMTATEKKEFEALQTKVSTLEKELAKKEDAQKIYHYWSELPNWAHDPLMALYKAGLFSGKSASDLDISYDFMRMMVVYARGLKAEGKLKF